tara:strand:+ start:38 stop:427 length:390 start_codon:yes stop_codon:yes gene_type:complete
MIISVSELRLLIFKELTRVVTDTHYLNVSEIMNKPKDVIIERVIQKFKNRSEVGFKKYGVTLKDDDLPLDMWLTHIQEELMDAVNYIEKVKDVLGTSKTVSDLIISNKEIEAINKVNAEHYPEFYKPQK